MGFFFDIIKNFAGLIRVPLSKKSFNISYFEWAKNSTLEIVVAGAKEWSPTKIDNLIKHSS